MIPADLLFKALADPTRQRILQVLSLYDLSVTELVEVLDVPQSTVSRHLKVLRDAQLLNSHRHGTTTHYSACPPRPQMAGVAKSGEAPNHGGNNGGMANTAAVLRDRLLEWAGQEQLEPSVLQRLELTKRRREDGAAGDFFDVLGARWDQLRTESFGDAFYLEALTTLLPQTWTVADIGTGTGYLLPLLSSRFENVVAIEPAGRMLETARYRVSSAKLTNVEFRDGGLDRLPLSDDEVDLAIAALVLHHVEEPSSAIAELWRCIKPGGRLLVIEQDEHDHTDFQEKMGDRWRGFKAQTLMGWLSAAGFSEPQSSTLRIGRPVPRNGHHAPELICLVAGKPG